MSRVRVASFSVSLDGYGAGAGQSLEHPLGRGGEPLHQWFLPTRTFQRMVLGNDDGTTGPDDEFAASGFASVGAWILGRNMFGPVRGPWPDDSWKGWWGAEPAVPRAGVRAHPPRARAARDGGRDDLPLRHRRHRGGAGAGPRGRAGQDVRIGGGVSIFRQYLQAGLVDEVHLALRRRCSARAKRCSPASTCARSASSARATSRPQGAARRPDAALNRAQLALASG